MQGGATSKDLTISVLQVTNVDLANDLISGIATPGAVVEVGVNMPDSKPIRRVTANGAGNWAANFAVEGPQGDEKQLVDLQPGANGWANETR